MSSRPPTEQGLTPNQYQNWARVTMNMNLSPNDRILNCALGLGEAGEVQNLIKKAIYHQHGFPRHRDDIIDELGDVLWYVANMAAEFGVPLENVMSLNLEKLKARYPQGFDAQRSIDR